MAIYRRLIAHHFGLCSLFIFCLTACGGGGGGAISVTPPGPAPSDVQAPGGTWFGRDSAAGSVVFYLAETGKLRVQMHLQGGPLPSFGGGSVSVTSNNAVSGSFEVRGNILPPTVQPTEDLGCSVSGSVQERQALSVQVTCSDSGGIVYDEALTLLYDPNVYERDSSLAALAGDYTLEFQPATNSLNIAADGTIFGMIDSGARCLVTGTAEPIDTNFTLIDITWTMSSCTNLIGNLEGVEMSGFAMANPAPNAAAGSYYFLLTGRTQDGVYALSVLYERL